MPCLFRCLQKVKIYKLCLFITFTILWLDSHVFGPFSANFILDVQSVVQIFFHPEIYSSDFTTPLPTIIDKCIQSSPIDTRRALYKVYEIRIFVMVQIVIFYSWGLLDIYLMFVISECSAIWRINHVQGLPQKITTGFEEDSWYSDHCIWSPTWRRHKSKCMINDFHCEFLYSRLTILHLGSSLNPLKSM